VQDAIEQVLGEGAPPAPDGGLPEDVAGLVAEAQRLYAAAQAALDTGDLGAYQARINELQQILDALAELTGAATPSAEPSPSASP
jgi:hypothetical protein